MKLFLVAAGGSAGACLRYLMAVFATHVLHVSVLYATLAANLLGCFLIGLVWGLGSTRWQFSEHAMLLFATGFLGGLTTFSTFQLELFNAWLQRQYLTLLVYFGVSLIGGFFAVCLGAEVSKVIAPAAEEHVVEKGQIDKNDDENSWKNNA